MKEIVMERPSPTVHILTYRPYHAWQHVALSWTWAMYLRTGIGLGLSLSSNAIDNYFWVGASQLLGILAIFIGLPCAIGASSILKILNFLQKHYCPLCQWKLSHISRLSWLIWESSQVVRIGCLLILFLLILLGESLALWYWEYEEPLFQSAFLLQAGGGILICYMMATIIYLHIESKLERVTVEDSQLDIAHSHGFPILTKVIHAQNVCRS